MEEAFLRGFQDELQKIGFLKGVLGSASKAFGRGTWFPAAGTKAGISGLGWGFDLPMMGAISMLPGGYLLGRRAAAPTPQA